MGVKREAFTREELKRLPGKKELFIHQTQGVPSRRWALWIALYSGMRLEEICQLTIADIQEIEGMRCISFNEESTGTGHLKHVKTSAGLRRLLIFAAVLKKAPVR